MPKCQIAGCHEEAGYNPKTGKPNPLCKKHFKALSDANIDISSVVPRKQSTKTAKPKPFKKPKPESKPKVENFVLRGNELTINTTNSMKHIKVDRYTRAVIFSDDTHHDKSGKVYRYAIAIKQNGSIVEKIGFDNKKERDISFAKLQNLLSSL